MPENADKARLKDRTREVSAWFPRPFWYENRRLTSGIFVACRRTDARYDFRQGAVIPGGWCFPVDLPVSEFLRIIQGIFPQIAPISRRFNGPKTKKRPVTFPVNR